MEQPDRHGPEEPSDLWLRACEMALAEEHTTADRPPDAATPELRACVSYVRDCLQLLERVWPSGDRTRAQAEATGDTPPTGDGRAATRLGDAPDLAGFQILGEIARGGMGVVYHAKQLSLDRAVAVKCLPPFFANDPERLRRFRNEAKAAAKLANYGIVPVYDVLDAGGVPVLVMPYIEGLDLHRVLVQRQAYRRGQSADGGHPWATLPDPAYLERILPVLDRVVDAVTELHRADILHRDIKPSNILVDQNGNAWLTDFGLARLGDQGASTLAGQSLGTPGFMSPEQWAGSEDIDGRADVFSVGATLYQALVLELPYGRGRLTTDTAPPVAPSRRQRLLPGFLDRVVLKALAPDRKDRYQSAMDLQADWHRARRGLRPQADREWSWPRRLARSPGRARAAAAVAFLGLLALVAAVAPRLTPRDDGKVQGAPATSGTERTVEIRTVPVGGTVVFVPLDKDSGEPDAARAVRSEPGQTPARLRLTPGLYLVEAVVPGHGFHQVYRSVPDAGQQVSGYFAHLHWEELPNGTLQLPAVEVPPDTVTRGMARFEGAAAFVMGSSLLPEAPPHSRHVDPYYLDPREVTVAEYRKTMGGLPPELEGPRGDAYPITYVTYDRALACAEKSGKRLPTEAEYEFAATMGGSRRFPWGETDEPLSQWPFPPAGEPPWDRTPTDPPVFGLYSNVAEWTVSWPVSYPGAGPLALPLDYRSTRIVRGGPFTVTQGKPLKRDWMRGPRFRHAITIDRALPGLGFRCARSAKPTFQKP